MKEFYLEIALEILKQKFEQIPDKTEFHECKKIINKYLIKISRNTNNLKKVEEKLNKVTISIDRIGTLKMVLELLEKINITFSVNLNLPDLFQKVENFKNISNLLKFILRCKWNKDRWLTSFNKAAIKRISEKIKEKENEFKRIRKSTEEWKSIIKEYKFDNTNKNLKLIYGYFKIAKILKEEKHDNILAEYYINLIRKYCIYDLKSLFLNFINYSYAKENRVNNIKTILNNYVIRKCLPELTDGNVINLISNFNSPIKITNFINNRYGFDYLKFYRFKDRVKIYELEEYDKKVVILISVSIPQNDFLEVEGELETGWWWLWDDDTGFEFYLNIERILKAVIFKKINLPENKKNNYLLLYDSDKKKFSISFKADGSSYLITFSIDDISLKKIEGYSVFWEKLAKAEKDVTQYFKHYDEI